MADTAEVERLKAMGLTDQAIAEILGLDLAKYQADYQRQQAAINAANEAAYAKAAASGISNIDMYTNPIGAGEIIPGSTAGIMQGLGMYDPNYWAVMRTYGSESNKDDPNDVTERSTFAVDPSKQYRLVDGKGNVIGSTEGGDSIRSLVDAANNMSSTQGISANWRLEAESGFGGWNSVAQDTPDVSGFDKIAAAALPVVVSMIPGLQGVGAVLAQAGAGAAGSAITRRDPLKGAIVGGLTAAGSEFLGPAVQSVNTPAGRVATDLGSFVGTTAGSFAGNVATGQSLKNSLINAGVAGAQDFLMRQITGTGPRATDSEYDELMSWARDNGIFEVDLPDGSRFDFVTGTRFPGGSSALDTAGATGTGGSTVVTAPGGGNAGIGGGAGGTTVVTARDTGGTKTQDTTGGSTTVVTARDTGGDKTVDDGKDTSVSNIDVTGKKTVDDKTVDDGKDTSVSNIDVTGKKTVDDGKDTSVTNIDVTGKKADDDKTVDDEDKEPPPGDQKDDKDDKDDDKKKWTWKDWVRLGLVAPVAIRGIADLVGGGGDGSQTIVPDQSRVTFTPLNRQRGVGSFDPFTYGQAGPGYQTAEYDFYKPYSIAQTPQTNVPFSVSGTPTGTTGTSGTSGTTTGVQYTQAQADELNRAANERYAANTALFNTYQDELAKRVEAGTMTLDQAIAQANTFGAGLGGIAPVAAADGGYISFADGGEVHDDMVKHLIEYRKGGGHDGPGRVKGIGSGQDDKIPAWLSDGEYVWSAQDVADLGDGSTDEGVRRLDKMRQMVRKQAGRKDVKKIAKPQKGIDQMLKSVGGVV